MAAAKFTFHFQACFALLAVTSSLQTQALRLCFSALYSWPTTNAYSDARSEHLSSTFDESDRQQGPSAAAYRFSKFRRYSVEKSQPRAKLPNYLSVRAQQKGEDDADEGRGHGERAGRVAHRAEH